MRGMLHSAGAGAAAWSYSKAKQLGVAWQCSAQASSSSIGLGPALVIGEEPRIAQRLLAIHWRSSSASGAALQAALHTWHAAAPAMMWATDG